jgi:hypothetical protein
MKILYLYVYCRESKRERTGGAEIGSEKKTIPQFVNRGGDSHPVILLFFAARTSAGVFSKHPPDGPWNRVREGS